MEPEDNVRVALAAHDQAVAEIGRSIWVGAEPTYTDRSSESPEWLFDALGDEKRERAEQVLGRLVAAMDGAAVLRCVGRQYGGEPVPRWSYGVYTRRDGKPVWTGPADPLSARAAAAPMPQPEPFAEALASALQSMGMFATTLDGEHAGRVVFRTDEEPLQTCAEKQPLLARRLLHEKRVQGAEVVDSLADSGLYLVICSAEDGQLRAELPAIPEVRLFEKLLDALSEAGTQIGAPSLILMGYPPPVDRTIAWMTVTADPAVIEINMAPASGTVEMLADLRRLESAAAAEGLDSFRLQYNGEESDSGGGGQVTLGGPSPEASPFLTVPTLLPSLVRYFNRHPSLSYLHAFESVGPASQAPRADEGVRGALPELGLSLELLSRVKSPSPETLWGTLAPFLADPSGNSHRAEINIEKLWNAFLGGRGRQGLVEFRALRMGPSAETTAAMAALLRAVVAMLAEHPNDQPLIDWGDTLHQRFSLPFYLHRDLEQVLSDLEASGLGLGAPLIKYLMRDKDLVMTSCDLGETRLELRRALEFWPLVGDVATQERGGSRLIDASTSRLEIRLRDADDLAGWCLAVGDWDLPLRDAVDASGAVRLVGLRYRSFVPGRGLHPTLAAQTPLTFTLSHPRDGGWRVTVHTWDPDGKAYPGLPATVDEARARRRARCVVRPLDTPPVSPVQPPVQPPAEAIGEHVIDLRWR